MSSSNWERFFLRAVVWHHDHGRWVSPLIFLVIMVHVGASLIWHKTYLWGWAGAFWAIILNGLSIYLTNAYWKTRKKMRRFQTLEWERELGLPAGAMADQYHYNTLRALGEVILEKLHLRKRNDDD